MSIVPPDSTLEPSLPEPGPLGPEVRQACLKPEYAAEYPGVDPGVWYPATLLADYFRARLARRPTASGVRILDVRHFDFQGGTPRDAPWQVGGTDERRI